MKCLICGSVWFIEQERLRFDTTPEPGNPTSPTARQYLLICAGCGSPSEAGSQPKKPEKKK